MKTVKELADERAAWPVGGKPCEPGSDSYRAWELAIGGKRGPVIAKIIKAENAVKKARK